MDQLPPNVQLHMASGHKTRAHQLSESSEWKLGVPLTNLRSGRITPFLSPWHHSELRGQSLSICAIQN